jgi:hypothetical protein
MELGRIFAIAKGKLFAMDGDICDGSGAASICCGVGLDRGGAEFWLVKRLDGP